jgi:hypothetical protein
MLFVYLDSGERREVPKAVEAMIRDDKLVCLSEKRKPVAAFPVNQVYLCSKTKVPSVPD